MKIALLGYGKMGKAIEEIAIERGHTISLKVTSENKEKITAEDFKNADVAIDFSTPDSLYENVVKCFEYDLPIVVGTTGWYDKLKDVKYMCDKKNQSLLYASNFSVGVNIFFQLNKKLAEMMSKQPSYNVQMEEVHHTQKLDAPSGTAITLANDLINTLPGKSKWINAKEGNAEDVAIHSIRENEVPGTHTVSYKNDIDTIEIKHIAHNRIGFALGAVIAAEWLEGKKGVYQMQDVLSL